MLTHNPFSPRTRRGYLRRCLAALLAVMMLCSLAVLGTSASAATVFPANATPTRVSLNGEAVLEGECVIIGSVTYVPLRRFCSLFDDCRISWNGTTRTATATTSWPRP